MKKTVLLAGTALALAFGISTASGQAQGLLGLHRPDR